MQDGRIKNYSRMSVVAKFLNSFYYKIPSMYTSIIQKKVIGLPLENNRKSNRSFSMANKIAIQIHDSSSK